MSVAISPIHGDALAQAWPFAAPIIGRTISRWPDWTALGVDGIRKAVEANTLALWAIYDPKEPLPFMGVGASGLRREDGKLVAEIQLLGGSQMHEWLDDSLVEFENLAFENGVDMIRITGRRSWKRKLPDYIQVKKLADGRVVLEKWIR